jgi:hypothetical protein
MTRKRSAQLDREIATSLRRRHHATRKEDLWDVAMDAIMEGDAKRAATIVKEIRANGDMSPAPLTFYSALQAASSAVRDRFYKLANLPLQLYVEGVGHRLRHGYEVHWSWITRRGDKKIDSGVLTGDLPEFFETWPDYRGQKATIQQMKKIMDAWVRAGEFGSGIKKVSVALRKSHSEVPIR